MSRVGKVPVKVKSGVKVALNNGVFKAEGPKGKLDFPIMPEIEVKIEGDQITVTRRSESPKAYQMHGTTRTVINNLVHGVSEGFKKELDITGVGYRAAVKGKTLSLTLGLSHPVDFPLPEGVTAKVEKNTHLILEGPDKVILGETAAKIRSFRPPEPYQGKGIRYSDERILRKQGKAAGSK